MERSFVLDGYYIYVQKCTTHTGNEIFFSSTDTWAFRCTEYWHMLGKAWIWITCSSGNVGNNFSLLKSVQNLCTVPKITYEHARAVSMTWKSEITRKVYNFGSNHKVTLCCIQPRPHPNNFFGFILMTSTLLRRDFRPNHQVIRNV